MERSLGSLVLHRNTTGIIAIVTRPFPLEVSIPDHRPPSSTSGIHFI